MDRIRRGCFWLNIILLSSITSANSPPTYTTLSKSPTTASMTCQSQLTTLSTQLPKVEIPTDRTPSTHEYLHHKRNQENWGKDKSRCRWDRRYRCCNTSTITLPAATKTVGNVRIQRPTVTVRKAITINRCQDGKYRKDGSKHCGDCSPAPKSCRTCNKNSSRGFHHEEEHHPRQQPMPWSPKHLNGLSYPKNNHDVHRGFEIECFLDHLGSDIKQKSTSSFGHCLDICKSTSHCVDVAYRPIDSGRNCCLRDAINQGQRNQANRGARLENGRFNSPSTSTTSPMSPNRHPNDEIRYPQSNRQRFRSGRGATFIVECSRDRQGGDMDGNPGRLELMEECIASCDQTRHCVAVSLQGDACYLKDQRRSPRHNPSVIEAVKRDGAHGGRRIKWNTILEPTESSDLARRGIWTVQEVPILPVPVPVRGSLVDIIFRPSKYGSKEEDQRDHFREGSDESRPDCHGDSNNHRGNHKCAKKKTKGKQPTFRNKTHTVGHGTATLGKVLTRHVHVTTTNHHTSLFCHSPCHRQLHGRSALEVSDWQTSRVYIVPNESITSSSHNNNRSDVASPWMTKTLQFTSERSLSRNAESRTSILESETPLIRLPTRKHIAGLPTPTSHIPPPPPFRITYRRTSVATQGINIGDKDASASSTATSHASWKVESTIPVITALPSLINLSESPSPKDQDSSLGGNRPVRKEELIHNRENPPRLYNSNPSPMPSNSINDDEYLRSYFERVQHWEMTEICTNDICQMSETFLTTRPLPTAAATGTRKTLDHKKGDSSILDRKLA